MKFIIYIIGITTGVFLSYFYFASSKSTIFIEQHKQLIEKIEKVEILTQKNTALAHEVSSLSDDYSNLSSQLVSQIGQSRLKETQAKEDEIAKKIAAKNKTAQRRLKEFKSILNLSEWQLQQIEKWEQGSIQYWKMFYEGSIYADVNEHTNATEFVKSILSEEQLEIYDLSMKQKKESRNEWMATYKLGEYPVTMQLTDEQKDHIYQNLYHYYHRGGRTVMAERPIHADYKEFEGREKYMIWAAEEVLTEEQAQALIQFIIKSR